MSPRHVTNDDPNSASASGAVGDSNDGLEQPLLSIEDYSQSNLERQETGQDDEEQQRQETNNHDIIMEEVFSAELRRRQLTGISKRPLACSSTTPFLAKLLVPVLCVLTHVLFYYGQTMDMWKLRGFADIDVWVNSTNLKAKTTFDALGLDHDIHLMLQKDEDVETFTYAYAIKQLWRAKDLPGSKVLPRMAAILLVIFSGIWPHLKLFLLQCTWFGMRGVSKARTTTLSYLSMLGKWSLADVLTVCVMVGVLHLDWDVEPDEIKHGVVTELPSLLKIVESMYTPRQLCTMLLDRDCGSQKLIKNKVKCQACRTVVDEAYSHPDWAKSTGRDILRGVDTSGGGIATLRVVGMAGIYYFCAAVILSIGLSLLVDLLDHYENLYYQKLLESHQQGGGAGDNDYEDYDLLDSSEDTIQRDNTSSSNNNNDNALSSHLELDMQDEHLMDNNGIMRLPPPRQRQRAESLESVGQVVAALAAKRFRPKVFILFLCTIATAYVVIMASSAPSMEREVNGAFPMLLQDVLGVEWAQSYSLRSLMQTTGAAGGWDILLMATFSLFCVFGPILRSCFTILLTMCSCCFRKRPRRNKNYCFHSTCATIIQFLGAFCAWEVFVIAIVMVDMLMPSITSTIIQLPVCHQISSSGKCLEVEFNILPNIFGWIIIGGMLLVAVSMCVVGTINTSLFKQQRQHSLSSPSPQSYLEYTTTLELQHDENDNNYIRLEEDEIDQVLNNDYDDDQQQREHLVS